MLLVSLFQHSHSTASSTLMRPTEAGVLWKALIAIAALTEGYGIANVSVIDITNDTVEPIYEVTTELPFKPRIGSLTATSMVDLSEYVRTGTDHSIVHIEWETNTENLDDYSYRIEMKVSDSKKSEWMPIYSTRVCCNITYYHIGQSRTIRIRLAVTKTEEEGEVLVSEYVESDVIFLPNHHVSSIHLTTKEVESRLYVWWSIPCEEFSKLLTVTHSSFRFELKYRHMYSTGWDYSEELSNDSFHTEIPRNEPAEYIVQLFAITEDNIVVEHSEPFYHKFEHVHTPEEINKNRLVLKGKEGKAVKVDAVFDEAFESQPMRYNLAIRQGSAVAPQLMLFTSHNQNFPIDIVLDEYFEMYFLKLKFELAENVTESGVTETLAILTEESLPSKVTHAQVKLSPPKSKEYAILNVRWSAPKKTNGLLRGYKIRWKTTESKYSLFEVDQCEESYDLKAFSHNTAYQIFISARTSKGYGPEEKLVFTLGSPPDWVYYAHKTTTSSEESTTNPPESPRRIEFEPKWRKDINQDYGIGHARIFLFISSFMMCAMIFFLLKKLFFSMKGQPEERGRPRQAKADMKRRKKGTSASQVSKVSK